MREIRVPEAMLEASDMTSGRAAEFKTAKADDAETNTCMGAARTKTRKSNLSPRVFPSDRLPSETTSGKPTKVLLDGATDNRDPRRSKIWDRFRAASNTCGPAGRRSSENDARRQARVNQK